MRPDWTDEDVYLIAERARMLAGEGRSREAAVLFEGLAAIAPENVYVRNALAVLRRQLEEHAE